MTLDDLQTFSDYEKASEKNWPEVREITFRANKWEQQMNRDQIVLIKGLLEREYVAYAELANRPEDHPLFDEAQADYYNHQADKVKEAHKVLLAEFDSVLKSDKPLNTVSDEKDLPIWGVTIDGVRTNTPLRTYSQARSQARRIAERFDDWLGIEVVSFQPN